jgi:predicted outer membrane repeat protein
VGGGILQYGGGDLTIINSQVNSNRALGSGHYGGGGIYTESTTISISGSQINNNFSATGGGGMQINSGAGAGAVGSMVVTNSAISGNTANFYGGGILNGADIGGGFIDGVTSMSITNTHMDRNVADSFSGGRYGGGAIMDFSLTSLTITGSFLNMNSAPGGDGGAFEHNDSSLVASITGTQLNNNSSGKYGGAIDVDFAGASSLTLTGDTFSGDRANYGGAISNQSATVIKITGGLFSNDRAAFYGGAIANNASTQISVSATTFSTDGARYGGAIDLKGGGGPSFLSVTSSTFSNNTSTFYGGAIAVEHGAPYTVALSSVTATNNSGTYGGFMLDTSGTAATVTSSKFTGNAAASDGGAIYMNGELSIISSNFNNNSARNDGGAVDEYGGAADLTITSTTFNFNRATFDGGAVNYNSLDNGTLSITSSTFTTNHAGAYGGAIDTNAGTTDVFNSTIGDVGGLGNIATRGGGGIYFHGGSAFEFLFISGSTIAFNSSANGGGLLIGFDTGDPGSGGGTFIQNSTISFNKASLYGGGIANFNVFVSDGLEMIYATVNGNTAFYGGGIFTGFFGDATELGSTILTGNHSTAPGGNFSPDGWGDFDGLSLGFNLFGVANGNNNFSSNIGSAFNITGNANLGALQNNGGPTKTQALGPGSAANNTGSNGVLGVTVDQRGHLRGPGIAADIGAFDDGV